MTSPITTIPANLDDPINRQILTISEDQIQGFVSDPIEQIAQQSGVAIEVVIERLKAMLTAGTIRRIRQTLLSTSLAPGALVAWEVEPDELNSTFDYMFGQDPFSGHVVIRTCDTTGGASDNGGTGGTGGTGGAGAKYRLWTTIKVPKPFSLKKHCQWLCKQTGATRFRMMPALKLFVLGVGHVRRRDLEPGERTEEPAVVRDTKVVDMSEADWRVLTALKREFEPDELCANLWASRAAEAGLSTEDFCAAATDLNERGVIGRFSTFLEHVKKHKDGKTVTRYNGLFHWAVPAGSELAAGKELGRHLIMTHAYWREGGPEFNNVNIMGVAHGMDKDKVLAHKAAIDQHFEEGGFPVSYTNVFWGGRSEIKPSEISPIAYTQWCKDNGIDPATMHHQG